MRWGAGWAATCGLIIIGCTPFEAANVVDVGGDAQTSVVGPSGDGGLVEGGDRDGDAGPFKEDGGTSTCSPTVSCDAGCSDRCPAVDDLIEVEQRMPTLRFRNLADCHFYQCTLVIDPDVNDGFDCAKVGVGRVGKVCSIGAVSCGTTAFSIGVSSINNCTEQECTWTCTIVVEQ